MPLDLGSLARQPRQFLAAVDAHEIAVNRYDAVGTQLLEDPRQCLGPDGETARKDALWHLAGQILRLLKRPATAHEPCPTDPGLGLLPGAALAHGSLNPQRLHLSNRAALFKQAEPPHILAASTVLFLMGRERAVAWCRTAALRR